MYTYIYLYLDIYRYNIYIYISALKQRPAPVVRISKRNFASIHLNARVVDAETHAREPRVDLFLLAVTALVLLAGVIVAAPGEVVYVAIDCDGLVRSQIVLFGRHTRRTRCHLFAFVCTRESARLGGLAPPRKRQGAPGVRPWRALPGQTEFCPQTRITHTT